MKSEYCSTKIDEKQVFLALTKGHGQNCPVGTELVFVSKQEMSKISKCTENLVKQFHINDIEVLSQKSSCEKNCPQNSCTLIYQINYRKYKAVCKPKTLQQQRITLCQKIHQNTASKDNSYSNLNVVALVVLVFIVSTAVSILSIL